MLIVGILSWWYTVGWQQRIVKLREGFSGAADYFSLDLLLRTLFSPFRQISVGRVDGSLGVRLQAFIDRILSRCIGALIRLFMIVVGSFSLLVYLLFGCVMLAAWAIVPIAPIVGFFLWIVGWVPWKL
jgi:hypothetical protein